MESVDFARRMKLFSKKALKRITVIIDKRLNTQKLQIAEINLCYKIS